MIKQTLFFSTPVCLSLKNSQLVISWKDCDEKVTRPIEDIGCVVLESQMINITLSLLNEGTSIISGANQRALKRVKSLRKF